MICSGRFLGTNSNQNFIMKDLPSIKYKENTYNCKYCISVEIPVTFKTKQEYNLYEDDFGNQYYEQEYNFDFLEESREQNPIIDKLKDFLKTNKIAIVEEKVE